MNKEIHPKYFDCEIKCVCGNVIHTRSTRKEISTEICSKCHKFWTGELKFMDKTGRIEKFNKKYGRKTVKAMENKNEK